MYNTYNGAAFGTDVNGARKCRHIVAQCLL